MDNNFIISILGGILGGVLVNISTYEYKRRCERKEKIRFARKEHEKRVCEKLEEISLSLENNLSVQFPKYKQIQNDCSIFSNQLTNILSQIKGEVSEETIRDLMKLNTDLKNAGNYPLYNEFDFGNYCKPIIETAREIKKRIESCSNISNA
ncbi:hypothetical protein ACSAZK_16305 [Methanosarcina sp. Mfa9]|uniref:hypothetical protein n=1 Tax=Methanosarcina sp. Mfa9 TaxID=3439063 RepID=UPI003F836FA7